MRYRIELTLAETEKSIEFTIKYSGAQDSQFCAIQIQKLRENRKFERILMMPPCIKRGNIGNLVLRRFGL